MSEQFTPSAPAGLSDEAAAIWRELVPTIGGLQSCDIPSLVLLVDNMAELERQNRLIQEEGDIIMSAANGPGLNPRYKRVDRCTTVIDRLLNRFRCNPASRRANGQHNTDVVMDDKSEFFDQFDSVR